VAGYNAMSENEKAKYPLSSEEVSKNAGKTCLIVTIILFIFVLVLQFATSQTVFIPATIVVTILLVATAIFSAIRTHITVKKRKAE
jgi:4-hydroxybenzoate polyprenyltransferase